MALTELCRQIGGLRSELGASGAETAAQREEAAGLTTRLAQQRDTGRQPPQQVRPPRTPISRRMRACVCVPVQRPSFLVTPACFGVILVPSLLWDLLLLLFFLDND